MRMNRTRNATKNIISGMILKMYQLLAPFILRTIMIQSLGIEYVGLNSLFTSILQVLNLAELGVGSAMVYSMYKPIAEDDSKTICALMRLYKLYYRLIGLIVLISGLIILPFLPNLVSGDIPDGMNLYFLYLLNLGATVFSYWLFAYKNSILTAHQRTDVINLATIIISTFQYILQTVVLLVLKDYYAYLIAMLLSQVLLNILTAVFATKLYPQYKAQGKLDKKFIHEINQRVRDLFTSKLGSVIVNSADTIVISAFLGLTILGIYNNYYYIMNAVMGFVTLIFTSCTAGIGNSLIVEDDQKNLRDLNTLTFLMAWISNFCCCCFLCLYQPFITVWIGVEYLLDYGCVICIVIYFFVRIINQVLIVYKDAAGMWHEDRFRPLCTALTNLVLNIIMVQFIGLYGILLSTVISTVVVGMPWLIKNIFSVIFKMGMKDYIYKLLIYFVVSLVSCLMSSIICINIPGNSIVKIMVSIPICCIVPNVIYIVCFRNSVELRNSAILLDHMVGGKLKFIHRLCTKVE